MHNAIDFIKQYVDEEATYTNCDSELREKVSLYIAGSFEFYRCGAMGTEFLVMKPLKEMTVTRLCSMLRKAEEQTGLDAVLLLDSLTPYMIRKLIKDRVGFVVRGKQIYLPFMALQIKKERNVSRKEVRMFSPGTQLVYLYALYSRDQDIITEAVMEKLHISKMTSLRGLMDLVDLGLLKYDITGKTGRRKVYRKVNSETFFEDGRKHLTDPVRETVYIRSLPEDIKLVKTGLTALAAQTMLSEPEQPVYALYSKERDLIMDLTVPKSEAIDENFPAVKLTKYDVGILGKDGYADPVSMMLCVEENDERIEEAMEELLGQYDWYQKEE